MIRSIKANLLALAVVCAAFGQAPAPAAKSADSTKADIYYHFAMGRLNAELAGSSMNQAQYIAKAIEHYRAALKLDPSNGLVLDELSDIYIQTGRIQDAIDEAEGLLKDDPNNLNARRLLGRVYTRAIADAPNGRINTDMVKNAIAQYQTITQKDPKDADSWAVLARLYRVTNDTSKAEDAFNQALKADPKNEEALTGLAALYADQGDTDRAVEKLKAATEKTPNARTFSALADAYEQARDFKNAAAARQRAAGLSPDDDLLQAKLAQDLYFSGQTDEALKVYQSMLEDNPHDLQSLLRVAEIYRAKGDLKKARATLDAAKQTSPNDVDTAYEEVNLLDAEGKSDEAISKLKDILSATERRNYTGQQSNYRARLLERLGLLYRGAGQNAQAADAFRQIASLGGDFAPRSAALVIDSYRQGKDFANALREAEAAVKKYPDDRTVRISYAEVLSDQGKIDEAVNVVKATEGAATDREIQLELAQIYQKGKRWNDMAKVIDAAERLSKTDEDKESVWFMRGAMLERMKKFDQAEAEFRKVLQADPQNAGALNYLGYMLADRDVRLEEAHDLIQKAVDLDPRNGAYLDSLGWVCYRQGKFDQAEDLLVQALDRIGQDPTVHDHLGDVYLKLGKTKEAIAQWQASVREFQTGATTDNDPDEVAKVTRKLENARVKLAKENK